MCWTRNSQLDFFRNLLCRTPVGDTVEPGSAQLGFGLSRSTFFRRLVMDPQDAIEALENLQEILEDALEQIEDALEELEEGDDDEGFDRDRARRLVRAAVVAKAVRRRRRRSGVRRVARARAVQSLRAAR
jgi:hypothetical protein